MARYCSVCWNEELGLRSEVVARDVDDPKLGPLRDCYVCASCWERGVITRPTCRTFLHRWELPDRSPLP